MKITILGSGTSSGVPMLGCSCTVCSSKQQKDKRLRSSIMVQIQQCTFVIDAGPDFRTQLLREGVTHIDSVLLTHQHRDHIAGLDDIRAFNFFSGAPMPIYLTAETELAVRKQFSYAFEQHQYPGLPQMMFYTINEQPFFIQDIQITPIEVLHAQMPVLGFRIHDFTYITDANSISEDAKDKIKGSKIMMINALRKQKHISHFNLAQALQLISEIKPEKAYLTHISHQLGLHETIEMELPPHVFLAYDGLQIEL